MCGEPLVSTDGRSFVPRGNESGQAGEVFGFSPHNGNLAFGLFTVKPTAECWSHHPYGIWRTTDKGANWEQVWDIPAEHYESGSKRRFLVDPEPARQDWVFFASFTNGLMLSKEGGAAGTWSTLAFENRMVKTISAARSSGSLGGTILHVIVCRTMPAHVDGTVPR